MDYTTRNITIEDLEGLHRNGILNLNPPYQRNAIWSRAAQKSLIDTILNGWPLPALFFEKLADDSFEVVDGQQRLRAIFDFIGGQLTDSEGFGISDFTEESDKTYESFKKYEIALVTVKDLKPEESIEHFYSLVNRSGLRLNRPELAKATYYNTNFLRLIENLADDDTPFGKLGIFTAASKNRMSHVDFLSELVALMLFGVSDKKEKVDELFDKDISDEQSKQIFEEFNTVISSINKAVHPIALSRTRFRQKNDFYTLFGFFKQCLDLKVSEEIMKTFLAILLKISPAIKPSQEECDILREYARNCVTQSNSKQAREARRDIFQSLLLNSDENPNQAQNDILNYYELDESEMDRLGRCWLTFIPVTLKDPNSPELSL